ncbi:hypothetical protein Hypma_002651 [Hypsizygus marmoreus]|uniref:Telomere replication protein EST3 n=1 Tax=Hypsizygus marmoreus TaxID=39966 RepID=A0A369J745_HYPMA|nr:hypothetical protein Hypma_002651 [Hypsizygus marmoreus]
MSESIFPWISTYLINAAEEHGANMMAIPHFAKKKKVQLTEFLTYAENDVIWARISDKEHFVPIRFSRDAVMECTKLSRHRLTEHKSAIIFISDFKPFFARVPGKNGVGMSSEAFLALECNSLQLIGSYGEDRFGNPKPVESNSDLREWSEGLRKDGGAGNCLKLRKQAANSTINDSQHDPGPSRPHHAVTASITTHPSMQTARKTASTSTNAITNGFSTTNRLSKAMDQQEIWPVTRKPMFRRPPQAVAFVLAQMKVEGDPDSDNGASAECKLNNPPLESPRAKKRPRKSALLSSSPPAPEKEPRSRSATPFSDQEWPATDPAHEMSNQSPSSPSPAQRSPSLSPTKPTAQAPTFPSSQAPSVLTSQLLPPTPAQRTPRTKRLALPPSSPPSPSQAQETVLLPPPTLSPPTHARREVTRKVPRPLQPPPPSHSADPIVLVPNSDTSLSYSQSQSQSLSQSQQKSLSQPVVLSQLSALARTRKLPETRHEPTTTDDVDMRDDEQDDTTNFPNSLFSSQGKDYDGDQSSPSHSEPSEPRKLLAVPSPLSHSDSKHTDGDDEKDGDLYAGEGSEPRPSTLSDHPESEDELAGASLVVEASASQDSNDAVATADITMNPVQELDEDDAQTHVELFGPTQEHSEWLSPHEHGDIQTGSEKVKEPDTRHLPHETHRRQQLSSKSDLTPLPLSAVSSETDGKGSRSGPTDDVPVAPSNHIAVVGEVQHDAVSWSAPSFLRASSSKSKSTVSKSTTSAASVAARRSISNSRSVPTPPPHALKRSRLVNGSSENVTTTKLPEKPHLDATPSSTLRNRPQGAPLAPGDQNNDPFQHSTREAMTPQLSKQVYRSKETSQPSDTRDAQTQGNKRGRDVASDDGRASDEASHHHHMRKKRKVEPQPDTRNKEAIPDDDDDEVVFIKAEYRSQVTVVKSGVKRKLNGYTVNLDKIVLADEKEPWMDWKTLYEIMLRTDESRGDQ